MFKSGNVMGSVGVINIFASPYSFCRERQPDFNEERAYLEQYGVRPSPARQVMRVVSDHLEAAKHIADAPLDGAFDWFVEGALDNDLAYSKLRGMMPVETPPALLNYQERHTVYDAVQFDREVNEFGAFLCAGQVLFCGGVWDLPVDGFYTDGPLSTTFNPQKAWTIADWHGTPYDQGRLDIMVMTVRDPRTKAYHYHPGGQHGHEREVVFATGAYVRKISETYVCHGVVRKRDGFSSLKKNVPVYVIEAEIS